jgi:hypothetical protein
MYLQTNFAGLYKVEYPKNFGTKARLLYTGLNVIQKIHFLGIFVQFQRVIFLLGFLLSGSVYFVLILDC